jgi:hypothetical protein
MGPWLFVEDQRIKKIRYKMVDQNPMGDISLVEIPRKIFGIAERLGITQGTVRKRRKRRRSERMIVMLIMKNILNRMVDIRFLHLWKPCVGQSA